MKQPPDSVTKLRLLSVMQVSLRSVSVSNPDVCYIGFITKKNPTHLQVALRLPYTFRGVLHIHPSDVAWPVLNCRYVNPYIKLKQNRAGYQTILSKNFEIK